MRFNKKTAIQILNKWRKTPRLYLSLLRGFIQMKLAIRTVNEIYKKEGAVRWGDRENIQFLVLLEIPVLKKGKIRLKERVYWVNRRNFRKLKKKNWLPYSLKFDDLRRKAFYATDRKRNYEEEQIAREKAMSKYIKYLKAK